MRYALLSLAIILLVCPSALAKGTGTIKGRITTENGKGLRAVILLHSGKAEHTQITTATDGSFRQTISAALVYTATISAVGYERQRITQIHPLNNRTILLNVQLHKSGTWGSSVVMHIYVPQEPAVTRHRRRPSGLHYRPSSRSGYYAGSGGVSKSDRERISTAAGSGERVYGIAAPVTPEAMPAFDIMDKASPGAGREVVEGKLASAEQAVYVPSSGPAAHAGMLTSGEINDFSKWKLWEDMSTDALKGYRTTWPFRPEARYSVIIKSKEGTPLCNARVKMSNGGKTVWEAITDNTGKAELWYGMWNTTTATAPSLSAAIDYQGKVFSIRNLKPFEEGTNIVNTQIPCFRSTKVDIAFIVDATGSMQDEINYLKAELRDILQKVKDSMPAAHVQTGALFYRDLEDEYVTRTSDLTADFGKTEAFIADNNAEGGGDFPEAVDMALQEGLDGIHWREDASARLAFLVLDAPPHNDAATVQRMEDLSAQYAARGIRLIPVVCSGSDKSTEYLMRSIALATNGTYLFLTDHSGIGGAHTAPTTDKYDVEYLNGLIYRVIYQCSYMPECRPAVIHPDSTVVHQPLSTDSLAKAIDWKYYPNPTTGVLHIQHTATSGELYICDITGKAIMRFTASASGITTVDVSQYPAGVYFIRFNYSGDQWVSGRFILRH